MKKSRLCQTAVLFCLILLTLPHVVSSAEPTPCAVKPDWLPISQTKPGPPNPNQPFDSFCAFHQWSWQAFLWLTQQVDDQGTLRFETFPSAEDVVNGKTSPSGGPLKLVPRTGKQNSGGPINEINQAGEEGVLVDHNGRAVYYSMYVNPQMFKDIVSQHWNNPAVLSELAVKAPETQFELGDLEIKVSWKILGPNDDPSTMFVRDALVAPLVNRNGKIFVDHDSPPLKEKVGMVGFHVAGWVQDHPEAIWATFEHVKNAPNFAPEQNIKEPVSDKDWTFYTANTKAIDCNQLNAAVLKLDQATQTLSPITQVARVYPMGMVAGSKEKNNDIPNALAIKSLNQSVWDNLPKDSMWHNYEEIGAVWSNDFSGGNGLKPNETLQDKLVGSNLLSNTTIETFTQNIRAQHNCFSCHNSMMDSPDQVDIDPLEGNFLNLSHIILKAYIENQDKK